MNLTLKELSGDYWIAQLKSLDQSIINQIQSRESDFWSISQTSTEISLVSTIPFDPLYSSVEGPWSAFGIDGQLDFALTGILSKCSTILADAGVSIFAVSTFDTDYFLVRKAQRDLAISAWTNAGINFL